MDNAFVKGTADPGPRIAGLRHRGIFLVILTGRRALIGVARMNS
jgi:hypothetical protein